MKISIMKIIENKASIIMKIINNNGVMANNEISMAYQSISEIININKSISIMWKSMCGNVKIILM